MGLFPSVMGLCFQVGMEKVADLISAELIERSSQAKSSSTSQAAELDSLLNSEAEPNQPEINSTKNNSLNESQNLDQSELAAMLDSIYDENPEYLKQDFPESSLEDIETEAGPDSPNQEQTHLDLAEIDLKELWQEACTNFSASLEEQIFEAWIKPLKLTKVSFPTSFEGDVLVIITAPNVFSQEHVQKNYAEQIRVAFSKILFARVKLQISAEDQKALAGRKPKTEAPAQRKTEISKPQTSEKPSGSELPRHPYLTNSLQQLPQGLSPTTDSERSPQRVEANSSLDRSLEKVLAQKRSPDKLQAVKSASSSLNSGNRGQNMTNLSQANINPKYNFSNFVVGSCNQFAHAIGLKVSDFLGSAYNPLFIYGGVGLGKTHLANAIANSVFRRGKKVLLVSSEAFVSELIASLRSNKMENFKSKFRSLDLLIIDDIQFIVGKERTQEEFFHTFNDLHQRQKQIIITSDKLPQELVGIEERLRTRFASGLSVDLQIPDFETRVAILTKKAESEMFELPDDVARFLAEGIATNIRELEGAMNRLKAVSLINNRSISLDLAKEVLSSIINVRQKELSSDIILKIVAEKYNVSLTDIVGKRRTQNVASARQIAMYLCRRLSGYSFPEIGALFGGRDHTTVIHANKLIAERLGLDSEFKLEIENLEKKARQ